MTADVTRLRRMHAGGMTLVQIGEATGLPVSTVRSWIVGSRTPRGAGCSWERLAPWIADCSTVAEQADRLGVARSTVRGWRDGQPIPWQIADRIAVRIGEHPAVIWADEWHDIEEVE